MAGIWADSFDWYTKAQLTRVYSSTTEVGTILLGAYGPDGVSGIRFSGVNQGDSIIRSSVTWISGATCIAEFDFRMSAYPSGSNAIVSILDGAAADATTQVSLRVDTSGQFLATRGANTTAVTLATSSYVIPLDTYIHLSLKVSIDNSTGEFLLTAWSLPGLIATSIFTLTGQDTSLTGTTVWDGFSISGANNTGTTDFANYVVMDGSGSRNNDRLGPVTVLTKRPNAEGAHSDFTPLTGSNNATLVADVTADDDTTYNSSSTSGHTDSFAFEDLAQTDLPLFSALIAQAKRTGNAVDLQPLARQGATDTYGTGLALSTTYASLVVPGLYQAAPNGDTWTAEIWNGIEWGYRLAASEPARVTQLVAIVVVRTAAGDCSAAPTYEDPCQIKSPIFIAQIEDIAGTVTQHATRPMRNSSTYLGGFTQATLLDISPIVRQASDYLRGSFPVQSATVTIADTRRYIRDAIDADDGDAVNYQMWLLLLSEAGRVLEVTPRALFSGPIYHDPLGPHLTYKAIANDVIGVNYSLHADEVMVPQTRIEDDFPGYGQTNLFGGGTIGVLGGPIIGGEVSDENASDWPSQQTAKQGVLKGIYAGLQTCLDGVSRHRVIIACHPCKSIINAYQGDDAHTVIAWGTTAFAPGKTNWSTVNPNGSALYTQYNNRWWTVAFFNTGTIGDAIADDSTPVYFNVQGLESVGDGTGTLITDLLLQYKHCLLNFFLPTPCWQMGAWLASPVFPLYAGGPDTCRVDTGSFTTASAVASGYLAGGFVGGFVIGADGQQQALRDVIAQFNVQCNVSLGWNQYSQLFVKMLDRDRDTFIAGRRTISDRRDILRDPPFEAPFDRAMLANNTRYDYRQNYNTGAWDAIHQLGSGPSFTKYNQSLFGEVEAYTLIRDDLTAGVVNQQRLDVRAFSRRTPTWGEGLCGLQRDVLDGWPLTHFGGEGTAGYVDAAIWIRSVTIDPKTCRTLFTAMAVERLMAVVAFKSGSSQSGGGSLGGPFGGPGGMF
jgi:hypothetical protein